MFFEINYRLFSQHIIINSLILEEGNIIKDKWYLFRLKKELNYTAIKHKPVRVRNCWSNNYIEYKSNSDKNKTLSLENYLSKIRLNLKDIINNIAKFDT